MLCLKGVPNIPEKVNSQPKKKKKKITCGIFASLISVKEFLLNMKKEVFTTTESVSAMSGQKSGFLMTF